MVWWGFGGWSTGVLEYWDGNGESKSNSVHDTRAGGRGRPGERAAPYTTRERVAGADPELDRWEVGLVEFLFGRPYLGDKTVYAWISSVGRPKGCAGNAIPEKTWSVERNGRNPSM
jgi:hypothetical protein